MIVTQDQLLELDKIKTDEFLQRCIVHAKNELGNKITVTDEALLINFEKWFYEARKYHITKETDVQFYLELCLVNSELAAEEKPRWMMMVLKKKSITGEKKMQRIYNKITEDAANNFET